MKVSLTVGKVDAGVAVLLTEDKRLIEFPSILLPPDIVSGSIVDVDVARNFVTEKENAQSFARLQTEILEAFGSEEPSAPVLRCRNATQTSVVLEWDPLNLATAELRSFSLYRNGSKAGSIPRPMEMTSTKISGLAVDTEYTFSLVLRTSAGTHSSEKLVVRTHKMTDLSGITITPGVMPPPLRESLERTIERIGAKFNETVRIDTTHFVCTEGRGEGFKKAQEMNIPVVVPDWVKGCEHEGRIVGVRAYYLGADPKLRQVGPGAGVRQDSTSSSPARPPVTQITPPTPETVRSDGKREDEADEEDSEESDEPPSPPPKDMEQSSNGGRAHRDEEEEYSEEEDDKGGKENEHPALTSRPKSDRPSPTSEGSASRETLDEKETDEGMEDVKL